MSGNSSPTSVLGIELPNLQTHLNPFGDSSNSKTALGFELPNMQLGNWQNPGEAMESMSGGKGGGKAATSTTTTPSIGDTNTTALQSQLASNSAAAMYGTSLTGGAGLLDSPSTTSRILLGS